MKKITKEELLKIAYMSRLHLLDHEIPVLMKQIQDVLSYAERVKEITIEEEEVPSAKRINVMREDVIVKTNPQPLLEQAPEVEQDYYVVPKILETE